VDPAAGDGLPGDDGHEDVGVGDVILDLIGETMTGCEALVQHRLQPFSSKIDVICSTSSVSSWE